MKTVIVKGSKLCSQNQSFSTKKLGKPLHLFQCCRSLTKSWFLYRHLFHPHIAMILSPTHSHLCPVLSQILSGAKTTHRNCPVLITRLDLGYYKRANIIKQAVTLSKHGTRKFSSVSRALMTAHSCYRLLPTQDFDLSQPTAPFVNISVPSLWSISSLEPPSMASGWILPPSHFSTSLYQFLTRLEGDTTIAFSISGLQSGLCRRSVHMRVMHCRVLPSPISSAMIQP